MTEELDPPPTDAPTETVTDTDTVAATDIATATDTAPEVDLALVERDLTAVETALHRLADGTYWTDEVTGAPLPEELLAADPTARRA